MLGEATAPGHRVQSVGDVRARVDDRLDGVQRVVGQFARVDDLLVIGMPLGGLPALFSPTSTPSGWHTPTLPSRLRYPLARSALTYVADGTLLVRSDQDCGKLGVLLRWAALADTSLGDQI